MTEIRNRLLRRYAKLIRAIVPDVARSINIYIYVALSHERHNLAAFRRFTIRKIKITPTVWFRDRTPDNYRRAADFLETYSNPSPIYTYIIIRNIFIVARRAVALNDNRNPIIIFMGVRERRG